MAYKFNPITGKLDYFEPPSVMAFGKRQQVVDANFLLAPDINLGANPLTDSEIVTLNGLEIDDSNYTILGSTLTMVTTQLKISDNIYIIFAS